jgi:ABC-type amino acid transport substrate-binding protein
MDRRSALLMLVIGGAAGLVGCERRSAAIGQSRFEKVIADGVIRAGFVNYPPGTIVSPSGEAGVSGIFPDLLRAIGQAAGLEVQFTEEVGYPDILQALSADRFDIVGGVWANPNRAKGATISEAAYYSGLGVWVRTGENRISSAKRWDSINDPDVRIGAIDGSSPIGVISAQFPKATLATYPNLTTEPQLFLDLAQGRIDVVLAEPAQGLLYSRSNPGRVRNLAQNNPVRIFENVFLMPPNEQQFKTFVDTAIADQRSSGRLQQLINQYQPVEGAFYLAASPFEVP